MLATCAAAALQIQSMVNGPRLPLRFVQSYFPDLEQQAGRGYASGAPLAASVVLLPPRTMGSSAAAVRPVKTWSCREARVWKSGIWSEGVAQQAEAQPRQRGWRKFWLSGETLKHALQEAADEAVAGLDKEAAAAAAAAFNSDGQNKAAMCPLWLVALQPNGADAVTLFVTGQLPDEKLKHKSERSKLLVEKAADRRAQRAAAAAAAGGGSRLTGGSSFSRQISDNHWAGVKPLRMTASAPVAPSAAAAAAGVGAKGTAVRAGATLGGGSGTLNQRLPQQRPSPSKQPQASQQQQQHNGNKLEQGQDAFNFYDPFMLPHRKRGKLGGAAAAPTEGSGGAAAAEEMPEAAEAGSTPLRGPAADAAAAAGIDGGGLVLPPLDKSRKLLQHGAGLAAARGPGVSQQQQQEPNKQQQPRQPQHTKQQQQQQQQQQFQKANPSPGAASYAQAQRHQHQQQQQQQTASKQQAGKGRAFLSNLLSNIGTGMDLDVDDGDVDYGEDPAATAAFTAAARGDRSSPVEGRKRQLPLQDSLQSSGPAGAGSSWPQQGGDSQGGFGSLIAVANLSGARSVAGPAPAAVAAAAAQSFDYKAAVPAGREAAATSAAGPAASEAPAGPRSSNRAAPSPAPLPTTQQQREQAAAATRPADSATGHGGHAPTPASLQGKHGTSMSVQQRRGAGGDIWRHSTASQQQQQQQQAVPLTRQIPPAATNLEAVKATDSVQPARSSEASYVEMAAAAAAASPAAAAGAGAAADAGVGGPVLQLCIDQRERGLKLTLQEWMASLPGLLATAAWAGLLQQQP
jgi:hypothetical protein